MPNTTLQQNFSLVCVYWWKRTSNYSIYLSFGAHRSLSFHWSVCNWKKTTCHLDIIWSDDILLVNIGSDCLSFCLACFRSDVPSWCVHSSFKVLQITDITFIHDVAMVFTLFADLSPFCLSPHRLYMLFFWSIRIHIRKFSIIQLRVRAFFGFRKSFTSSLQNPSLQ